MPTLKLHYFDVQGRAYPIRFALDARGIAYENVVISMDPKERAHFPTKQVPVLEVDGKYLGQTIAIMDYIGLLTDMVPTDAWQRAKNMELLNCVDDVCMQLIPGMIEQDPAKKIELQKKFVEYVRKWLKNVDGILKANGTKYACCEKMTLADIWIFHFVKNIKESVWADVPTDLADGIVDVTRVYETVLNSEEKKTYDSKVKESWR
eukprot:GHVO01051580.1.p1 GENE.GHVO01051580.1~~GHVO01051580.1.p1  ORF type:complete len:215 (+),score=42.56 GHVO01051580.1:28-645(+)